MALFNADAPEFIPSSTEPKRFEPATPFEANPHEYSFLGIHAIEEEKQVISFLPWKEQEILPSKTTSSLQQKGRIQMDKNLLDNGNKKKSVEKQREQLWVRYFKKEKATEYHQKYLKKQRNTEKSRHSNESRRTLPHSTEILTYPLPMNFIPCGYMSYYF